MMTDGRGTPIPGGPPLGTWKPPLRGALVVGAASEAELAARLQRVADQPSPEQAADHPPAPVPPSEADLTAPVRVALDYGSPTELADGARRALQALRTGAPAMWRMLRNRGVYVGRGGRRKLAFLYPGQGSQYVGMLAELRTTEPIVAETFAEADRILAPTLGRPLTDYLDVATDDPAALDHAERQLQQLNVGVVMLAADLALTRLLAAYGVRPDMVLGHSLGEYAALLAAGAFSLQGAIDGSLEGGRARLGRMTSVLGSDPGAMAAVLAPLPEVERIVGSMDGYLAVANLNSTAQVVIGGATAAVETAMTVFERAGHATIRLPISHAFHTPVTPAYDSLKRRLLEFGFRPPLLPVVANATGEFYPSDGDDHLAAALTLTCREIDEPVQFVKGLGTLYDAGARVFVEVGPRKVLHGFAEDVLGAEHDDAVVLFTNHPKVGDVVSFNRALCGLYAEGHGGPAVATLG